MERTPGLATGRRPRDGDTVRVGGLDYRRDPKQGFGKHISEMRLDDDTPVEVDKEYTVAGWCLAGQGDTKNTHNSR